MVRRVLFLGALLCPVVTAGPHRLVLSDDARRAVYFPRDFSFPFGGVRHSCVTVSANGFLALGAYATVGTGVNITRANWLVGVPGEQNYGLPVIGTWTDLAPQAGGEITAGISGPGEFRASWKNVRVTGNPGAVFNQDIVLRSDGSFQILFGAVTGLPPGSTAPRTIVGFSSGRANTSGTETALDLSSLPQPIGNGTETAVFEIYGSAVPFDLAELRLSFSPVLPGSGRLTVSDYAQLPLQIPGGFWFQGNRYYDVWLCAVGTLILGGPAYPGIDPNYFRHGAAMVAPLLANHSLSRGGTIRVAQTADVFTAQWIDVPAGSSPETSTFGATLHADGSMDMTFTRVARETAPAFTGISGGYAATDGTEGYSDLSILPQPLGANEPALFERWSWEAGSPPVNPFDLPSLVRWNAFPGPRPVSLFGTSMIQVDLQTSVGPLRFPFAGATYDVVWVSGKGNLSFESTDGAPEEQAIPVNPSAEFLARWPRIAPLWRDWYPEPQGSQPLPAAEGALRISRDDRSQTFTFRTKPWYNSGWTIDTEFAVTLDVDGSFAFSYPRITTSPIGRGALVGYSVGGNRPTLAETPVDLSERVPPATGEGNQTAVYEQFGGLPDLEGLTIRFAKGALPIVYRSLPRIGRTFEITLGDWPASSGLWYVAACSFGSGPTFLPPPVSRPIHLDLFEPLATLSLSGPPFRDFIGVLDGFGQTRAPALDLPNLVALVGTRIHLAFVTWSPSAGVVALPGQPIAFTIGS